MEFAKNVNAVFVLQNAATANQNTKHLFFLLNRGDPSLTVRSKVNNITQNKTDILPEPL